MLLELALGIAIGVILTLAFGVTGWLVFRAGRRSMLQEVQEHMQSEHAHDAPEEEPERNVVRYGDNTATTPLVTAPFDVLFDEQLVEFFNKSEKRIPLDAIIKDIHFSIEKLSERFPKNINTVVIRSISMSPNHKYKYNISLIHNPMIDSGNETQIGEGD
jgi:predicted Ser/Thr protein kinase